MHEDSLYVWRPGVCLLMPGRINSTSPDYTRYRPGRMPGPISCERRNALLLLGVKNHSTAREAYIYLVAPHTLCTRSSVNSSNRIACAFGRLLRMVICKVYRFMP